MLDVAVGLAGFCSMLLLVKYFQTESLKTAMAFGLVSALSALLKGNGNATVLMVPTMLLLTGRFHLLKRPGLYFAGVIFVIVGLPWQIVSLRMLFTSAPMGIVTPDYFVRMLTGYTGILMRQFTPLVAVLAGAGLVAAVLLSRKSVTFDSLGLAGAASLFIAVLLFHCIAPNPQDGRYMMPAIAAAVVLFSAGCYHLTRFSFPGLGSSAVRTAVIAGVPIVSAAFLGAFATPRFPVLGFIKAAGMALDSNVPRYAMLVCSDATGEGAFIAEVAMRDRDLSRIVLRASKSLSDSKWTANTFRMLFRDAAEVATYLDTAAVDVVVVDLSQAEPEEARTLLLSAIQRDPAKWKSAEVKGDYSRTLVVYTRASHAGISPGSLRIPLPYTLGRDVEMKTR
jgi:hypothetical protein